MIYKNSNNLYIKLFEARDAKSGDPTIVYQELFGGYRIFVDKKKDFEKVSSKGKANYELVTNITEEIAAAIKGLTNNPVDSSLEIK